ncbi:MAG: hypothetical protein KME04_05260 [Pleurocapsa minor GSE-CHR-MK-17-07R]|jgi:hypothetical protein|nr:hypothetical protein [Pleurocapsa minor GSE-CHR-MK 17-07R]
MSWLQNLFLKISRNWILFVVMLVANFASFTILFALEDQFEALAGIPVYDTQNALTTAQILEQLPLYQGEALNAYLRFAAFDFVFPLVSAIFIAVICTLLLRLNRLKIAQTLLRWRLPLVVLLITLFDYLENVGLLTVLAAAPAPDAAVMNFALVFKQLKLAGLALTGPLVGILVALLIADVARRVLNRPGRVTPQEA